MRHTLLFLLLCTSFSVSAQDVASLWISMPSELTPYLSLNQKKEMMECLSIGVDPSVQNRLQGTTTLDTLTTDYGRFRLSSSYDLQLIRLPRESADSIVCLIESYSAPAVKSNVSFYDLSWRKLPSTELFPDIDPKELLQKPDTMSLNTFQELSSWADPTLIEVNYNIEENALEVSLSIPYVADDDKEQIKVIIRKRKLIWNGLSYDFSY